MLDEMGDSIGAEREYREAQRLGLKVAELHGYLGSILYKKGDLDGAEAEFRTLTRMKPNDAKAHFKLGFTL